MDVKTCPGCLVEKPTAEFHTCKTRPDGLQVYCRMCQNARKRAWRKVNPAKVEAAYARLKARGPTEAQRRAKREWYRRNESRARAASKQYKLNHPEQSREYHLRRTYKMSAEQFDALWQSQNGQCAICHDPLRPGNGTHIDHNHACCPGEKTCGECVRGLLCGPCNRMLGCARDSSAILRAGADYLTPKIAGTCSPSPSPSSPSPR